MSVVHAIGGPTGIAFAGLLFFVVIEASASWRGKAEYRKAANLAEELLADPRANSVDRAWIRLVLFRGTHKRQLLLAPFAPFLALLLALLEAVEFATKPERSLQWIRRSYADGRAREMTLAIEEARRKTFAKALGEQPESAALWDDPRRVKLFELLDRCEVYQTPIASAWLAMWEWTADALGRLLGFALAPLYHLVRTSKRTANRARDARLAVEQFIASVLVHT